MLLPKDDLPPDDPDRMINPFLLPADGGFYLFYKVNGDGWSFSHALEKRQGCGKTFHDQKH